MTTMLRNAFATSPAARASSPGARVLPFEHAAGRRRPSRIAVGVGCVEVLWIYAALHVAHARGVDLPIAAAISAIPLFAIFIVSLVVAGLLAIVTARVLTASGRPLTWLPAALASSIVAFVAAVIVFP